MKSEACLEAYRGLPVAVLGASGFIGRWVARALDRAGASLALIVRDRASAARVFARYQIRGEILEADLGELAVVPELLRSIRPAVTFNLAGYGVVREECDERTAYRINAGLVGALVEGLSGRPDPAWAGRELVHAGSALEYGKVGGDLSEDGPAEPTEPYGRSKLAGTRGMTESCRLHRVQGVTARLFMVYGPGEAPARLLPSLLRAGRSGEPLALTNGTQVRDFTYVEDVAEGLLRLGLSSGEPGEVVNVATGRLTTVREFAETAAALIGMPAEKLRFGALPARPEEMQHTPLNIERLQKRTGWVPCTTIVEGIRKTARFEKFQDFASMMEPGEGGPASREAMNAWGENATISG